MNKKSLPLILILFLGAILMVTIKCKSNDRPAPKPKVSTHKDQNDPASNKNDRDRGFDRRVSYIKFSNHARCRMDCRKITQDEVEDVMKDGKINYTKSDLQNARCPRYALEGVTKNDERLRIIFAQCNESTVVVTVIDLDRDFECHCPGDDDKSKNRN